MLTLAIETATDSCGCAIGIVNKTSGTETLAAERTDTPRHHAEQLVPQIQSITQKAGVQLNDIEAIAVDIGPGLYTGLRVGVTTAITMATALNVDVIAATSLDIVANAHTASTAPADLLVAALDARRGEVFWTLYERNESETMVRLIDPSVATPEVAADAISAIAADRHATNLHVLGDTDLAQALTALSPTSTSATPQAEDLLSLAQTQQPVAPNQIAPLYLRTPDAVLSTP